MGYVFVIAHVVSFSNRAISEKDCGSLFIVSKTFNTLRFKIVIVWIKASFYCKNMIEGNRFRCGTFQSRGHGKSADPLQRSLFLLAHEFPNLNCVFFFPQSKTNALASDQMPKACFI